MGVRAAIEKALHALAVSGPLFCLHQLVHNESVVADLRAKGMRVVEALAEVPEGGTVLFSAHGSSGFLCQDYGTGMRREKSVAYEVNQ